MQYTDVKIGSYWANNFIHQLGHVVKVINVDGDTATCEVVRDADDTVTRLQCGVKFVRSRLGKTLQIKTQKFRPVNNPVHRGFLPASGPDDGRTSILTHEDVHPIKHRGLKHGPLLKLKWEHGWTVTSATGDVVDFEPRRKGDAQPWRTSTGGRFGAGQCEAEFPNGMRAWWGTTTETNATVFPTDQWFTMAHLLVSENAEVGACGTSMWRVVHPEDALGLNDDFSVHAVMCEKCEAEAPATVMASRIETRLSDWTGEKTDVADGSFDLSELDQL